MLTDGCAATGPRITLAGTPATVAPFGTSCSTTEPAAIRESSPTLILPRIFAPTLIKTAADFRMAVAALLAGPAKGDILQNGYVITDDTGLADHHTGRMIKEEALSEDRSRMDIDLKNLRHEALEVEGQCVPVFVPEPMGHPMGL